MGKLVFILRNLILTTTKLDGFWLHRYVLLGKITHDLEMCLKYLLDVLSVECDCQCLVEWADLLKLYTLEHRCVARHVNDFEDTEFQL